jgi:hypothetical protein
VMVVRNKHASRREPMQRPGRLTASRWNGKSKIVSARAGLRKPKI